MKLHLRTLQVRIQTVEGLYGTTIEFADGLNIFWADNNMGKSTCLLSIIYALGLERMLGPSSDVPLPHVFTHYVEDAGKEIKVLESQVFLEICNELGEIITIQRGVIGERDRRLVSTWNGPKLKNPSHSYTQRDYFLRDPGSATHEAGFHSFLANFLGWALPTVTKFNGTNCPLYLEAIFPLFVVEQKHGWGGIQANFPTFLGIREASKRALEFVLNVDAAKIIEEKQRLDQEEEQLRNQWKNVLNLVEAGLRPVNGRAMGISEKPTTQWPPTIEPHIEVYRTGNWIHASEAETADRTELVSLESESFTTVGETANALSDELEDAKNSLYEKDILAREKLEEIENERMQCDSILTRLEALDDDLEKNKDAQKLKTFGSVAEWSINDHSCPTCHQHLTDTLLPQNSVDRAMTIEDNIEFIRNQIKSFQMLKENTTEVVNKKESELAVMRTEIDSIRAKIRAIKQSLISPDSMPSIEKVRARLEVEGRLKTLDHALDEFNERIAILGEVSTKWNALQQRKSSLSNEGLSTGDQAKLSAFEKSLREQLVEFKFSSINPESLNISSDNYRPTREGFNLGFDLSASDNIRIIWAYLEGLLELASQFRLNHPGLLIFDEPRQQEAKEVSFRNLLIRAGGAMSRKQQVLFLTSEPLANLERLIQNIPAKVTSIEGWVIKKIS
jgi:hypothetical protein